jgi:hypothetical protein
MSEATLLAVGWDVGAWHCDRPTGSQDALVVKDGAERDIGARWRGNLTASLQTATTSSEFIGEVWRLCKVPAEYHAAAVVIAIDAPLQFPVAVVALLTDGPIFSFEGRSSNNPYLFRKSEQLLASQGKKPLSPIQDQIGSQAIKAIYARRKFAPQRKDVGVWSDGGFLTMIETYPGAIRHRLGIAEQANDIVDAARCAEVARTFALDRQSLEPPFPDAPPEEGWIWLPRSKAAGGIEP